MSCIHHNKSTRIYTQYNIYTVCYTIRYYTPYAYLSRPIGTQHSYATAQTYLDIDIGQLGLTGTWIYVQIVYMLLCMCIAMYVFYNINNLYTSKYYYLVYKYTVQHVCL